MLDLQDHLHEKYMERNVYEITKDYRTYQWTLLMGITHSKEIERKYVSIISYLMLIPKNLGEELNFEELYSLI